jgi:hypothetical protein
MNTLTDREKWDIEKMAGNKDYYYFLPEHRRTAAVSMAAVTANGNNLEYVPEDVINKDICRAALQSKDVDCTILSQIPFHDVQKEGIGRFKDVPAFVLYSFLDIRDAQMAQAAVKADAYCLQFVPDRLIDKNLCKLALENIQGDKKVLEFIPERYHQEPEIRKMAEEICNKNSAQKQEKQNEISSPIKKKGIGV